MVRKSVKTPEQLLIGALITAIRRVWLMSKERTGALKRAKVEGRGQGWKCECCGIRVNASKLLHVHHKTPVGKWESWDSYITKMFCGIEGYSVLCIACHHLIHKELEKK